MGPPDIVVAKLATGAVPKMGTCGLADTMSSVELARLATSEGGGVFVGGGVNTEVEAAASGIVAEGTAGTTKGQKV